MFLPLIKVHTSKGLQARTTLKFVLNADLDVSDIILFNFYRSSILSKPDIRSRVHLGFL